MSKPTPSRIAAQLPNLISLARAGLAVPVCLLLMQGSPQAIWLALALFTMAAATDFVDGAVARRMHATSILGSHLDPLADKVLVGAPLAIIPFTQAAVFAAPVIIALAGFVLAEGSMAWRRIDLLRQGEALPASPAAKWKTAAEYLGVAAVIAGLAPVPWDTGLQVAGSAVVVLAGGYAWLRRGKNVAKGER